MARTALDQKNGGIVTMELSLVFAKSMNLTRAQHLGFDLHAPVKKGEGVCRDARDLVFVMWFLIDLL